MEYTGIPKHTQKTIKKFTGQIDKTISISDPARRRERISNIKSWAITIGITVGMFALIIGSILLQMALVG